MRLPFKIYFFADTHFQARRFLPKLEAQQIKVHTAIFSQIADHLHPQPQLFVFIMPNSPSLQKQLLDFQKQHPEMPILWILGKKHSLRKQIVIDELHKILLPSSSAKAWCWTVEQLLAVAKWSLSPLLFDTIDIHVLLQKLLKSVADLSDCANARWILADGLNALLYENPLELSILVSGPIIHSPHFVSLMADNEEQFLQNFRYKVEATVFENISVGEPLWIPSDKNKLDLCLKVESIGVFYLENLEAERSVQIYNDIKLYIARITPHLRFAYDYWKALQLSFLDDLTDLYNQRYLRMMIDQEIRRTSRSKRSFSVLFLDLDYFKSVNDSKGHVVGSKLLVAVSHLLLANIRSCDFAFRYGGDEFVILLVETGADGAKIVAERIRQQVEDFRFLIDGYDIRLTVSIGLAAYPEHATSSDEIVEMADQAMYSGKNKSRNIVYIAS